MTSNLLSNLAEQPRLDEIDRAILHELANHARKSNKELAAAVGLAPSSCLQRVRRLIADGVIVGFQTHIAPQALGIGLQAMISLRLEKHSESLYQEFQGFVATLPEVVAVYHVTGRQDFLIHVAVRDPKDLQRFVIQSLAIRPEIGNIETALIFEHRSSMLPPSFIDDSPAKKAKGKKVTAASTARP